MAMSFVRSANICALVFKSQCPEVIQNCQPMFQKLVNPQLRDSLSMDMQLLSSLTEGGDDDGDDDGAMYWNERTAKPIPLDLRTAMTHSGYKSTRTAQFLHRITINGLVYTPTSKHKGNSCILLNSPEDRNQVPAQIQSIFQIPSLESVQTLIAIRRHQPSRLHHDPFSQAPILHARLWGIQLGELEVIRPDQIFSHFACLTLKGEFEDHIVAASLSRVSFEICLPWSIYLWFLYLWFFLGDTVNCCWVYKRVMYLLVYYTTQNNKYRVCSEWCRNVIHEKKKQTETTHTGISTYVG